MVWIVVFILISFFGAVHVVLNQYVAAHIFFNFNLTVFLVLGFLFDHRLLGCPSRMEMMIVLGLMIGFVQDALSVGRLGTSMITYAVIGGVIATWSNRQYMRDSAWSSSDATLGLSIVWLTTLLATFLLLLGDALWGQISIRTFTWSSVFVSTMLNTLAVVLALQMFVKRR